MLALEKKDVSPTLISTGDDVRVRDVPPSISRTPSGNVHRLRVKSKDEQEPSMSHLGPSTSPYLLDIEPGSSGSMGGVSRGDRSLTVRLSHLDISSPVSTSRSSPSYREGSISTIHSSLPASLGSREPSSRGVGRSQSHIQPRLARGVRRYHSTSSTGGADTTKSARRFGGKPSKNTDGIMKPIMKSNSGLASLFGGGNPKKPTKKSKSKKEEAPPLGAGSQARKKERYPRF